MFVLPLIQVVTYIYPAMEKNMKREPKRVFKGKTVFVIDHSTPATLAASKIDRHFHQRMLRAYLKGGTEFNFGFSGRDVTGRLIPQKHPVLFEWE